MPRQTLRADVLWGAKAGATLACICCAPAAIAFIASQFGSAPGKPIDAARILGAYLTFGTISGAIVGLCRPFVSSVIGAILVGALIGGGGFASLMLLGGNLPERGLLVFAAAIGAPVGAFFGWWIRHRFGQATGRPPRRPRTS